MHDTGDKICETSCEEVSRSDDELVRGCREGDPDCQFALHQRYYPRLVVYVRSRLSSMMQSAVDVEVIANSILRTVLRRCGGGQINLDEGRDLWPLFLTIARRRTIDSVRRASSQINSPNCGAMPIDEHLAGEKETPIDQLLSHEMIQRIMATRDRMPTEDQRRVFDFLLEGRGQVQIARLLDRSVASVNGLITRVRHNVVAFLFEGEEI